MVKTRCELYSRVVGYIRPVSNWNDSKQAEFADRRKFDEKGSFGLDVARKDKKEQHLIQKANRKQDNNFQTLVFEGLSKND